ncbi:hypothetical protein RND81_01G202700 [Saponaria officinalis]|uniref:Uncharacterized protein n=1 Tax=Saponaria officinalis TaxID=3572 RepID=A0AAW1NJU5_SAPOF
MPVRELEFGKAMAFLIKFITFPLSLAMGIRAITPISTAAFGFNFLGIVFIVIGFISLILLIVDCVMNKRAKDDYVSGSFCCGLLLYVLMFAFGIFALAVSCQGNGKSIPGIKYKEYKLSSYSKWVQHMVNNDRLWEKYYKRTLIKHNVCKDMVSGIYKLDTLDQLHQRPLNFFESGCCKPAEECKFNYTSPTVWTNSINNTSTTTSTESTNADCYKWSNDPNTYCFNCQSCKAAFAQDVKNSWYIPRLLTVIFLVIKVGLATLICCLYYCCKGRDSTKN